MATAKFISQDPSKPSSYAARISETEWIQYKSSICKMHELGDERKEMLSKLRGSYGFCPSISQLNARMAQWGLRTYKPSLPSPPNTSTPLSEDSTLSGSDYDDGAHLTSVHELGTENADLHRSHQQVQDPREKDGRAPQTGLSAPDSRSTTSTASRIESDTAPSTAPGIVVREEANGTSTPWLNYGYLLNVFGEHRVMDRLHVPSDLQKTLLLPASFSELTAADARKIENLADYLCALGSYTDAFDLYHLLLAFHGPVRGDQRPVVTECIINCARTASATNQRSVARMLSLWCLESYGHRPGETVIEAALHRCLSRLYIGVDQATSIWDRAKAIEIVSKRVLAPGSLSMSVYHREILALGTLTPAGSGDYPVPEGYSSAFHAHLQECVSCGQLGKYLVSWCAPVLARNIATFMKKLESYQGPTAPLKPDSIRQRWDLSAALCSLFLENWLKQTTSVSLVNHGMYARQHAGNPSARILVNEAFAALAFMVVEEASVPAANHIRQLLEGIQQLAGQPDKVVNGKFAVAYLARVVTRPFATSEPTIRSVFEKYRPYPGDLAGHSANSELSDMVLPSLPPSVDVWALVQIHETIAASKRPMSR